MTKKKLTKKQKQQMLYNATMIAEGAMDETNDMSYVQAWQHLVDTGACWELQGFLSAVPHKGCSQMEHYSLPLLPMHPKITETRDDPK